MFENWKPVRGYEGIYSVSDYGGLRIDLTRKWSILKAGDRLNPTETQDGYLQIGLSSTGSHSDRRRFMVHRLVCEAFVGPIPEGLQINHRDGSKRNNHISNLETVTCQENIRHAIEVLGKTRNGEANGLARLTTERVVELRERAYAGEEYTALGREFGGSKVTARNIAIGRTWRAAPGPLCPEYR